MISLHYKFYGYWSLGQRVTGANINPNEVVDLRKEETLNSFSPSKAIHSEIRTSDPLDSDPSSELLPLFLLWLGYLRI